MQNSWRAPISGDSSTPGVAGLTGMSSTFNGVLGVTTADGHAGVAGVCDTSKGNGVYGQSKLANGVIGFSSSEGSAGVAGANDEGNGNGVYGRSARNDGVAGVTRANGKAGVLGLSEHYNGNGVYGLATGGTGVNGVSDEGIGVKAESRRGIPLSVQNHGSGFPALTVRHNGIGPIILGYNGARKVLEVVNNGEVLVAGSISTERDISATGDVYARGVRLTSDENVKENFSSVNKLQILDNLASMPIQSWNYKEDPSSVSHIGPTAQDFHAAFGLNGDDVTHISSIDLQGIALAAIQGLNEKLKAENAQLHANLANLEARLSTLESKG